MGKQSNARHSPMGAELFVMSAPALQLEVDLAQPRREELFHPSHYSTSDAERNAVANVTVNGSANNCGTKAYGRKIIIMP